MADEMSQGLGMPTAGSIEWIHAPLGGEVGLYQTGSRPEQSVNKQTESMPRLMLIQYLRGGAAMLVVIHHACSPVQWGLFNPLEKLSFGASGVDIFFVISGFIMYTVARSEPPLEFYFRRFVRVVPLYWLATAAFIVLRFRHWGAEINMETILKSLFFVPFLYPFSNGEILPLLAQGWTLNLEMFFYAIFGIGIITKWPALTTALLLGAAVLLGFLVHSDDPIFVTYTRPIVLEFFAGLMLGKMYPHLNRVQAKVTGLRSVIFLSVMLLGVACILLSDLLPQSELLIRSLAAIAIVMGALGLEATRKVRKYGILKLLGDASYSIYLSHTLALILPRVIISYIPLQGWSQFVLFFTMSLIISAATGIAIHYFVERPILDFFKRFVIPIARSTKA